jgi:hypothetical protein
MADSEAPQKVWKVSRVNMAIDHGLEDEFTAIQSSAYKVIHDVQYRTRTQPPLEEWVIVYYEIPTP